MVMDIGRRSAIRQALNPGIPLEDGEVQELTSNTDEKVIIYSTVDGEPRPVLKIDAERVAPHGGNGRQHG